MHFRDHAEVVTADGEKVGDIDRVVMDPPDAADYPYYRAAGLSAAGR